MDRTYNSFSAPPPGASPAPGNRHTRCGRPEVEGSLAPGRAEGRGLATVGGACPSAGGGRGLATVGGGL